MPERLYLALYPRLHRLRMFHILFRLLSRYQTDRVFETGAMLAYFLLFSIFPLLIFLSALIPIFPVALSEGLRDNPLIPSDIAAVLTGYLGYLEEVGTVPLVATGLVLTVWFVSRTARSLIYAINTAMRVRVRRSSLMGTALSLLMSIGLLILLLAALVLLVAGDWLTGMLRRWLPAIAEVLWGLLSLRGVLVAVLAFVLLLTLYTVAPNRHVGVRRALPGTVFSMAGWALLSAGFSWYVEGAGRYSLLYGSLGGVVVLLLWLYLTGVVLVMGAELNDVLLTERAWQRRQRAVMCGSGPYYMVGE